MTSIHIHAPEADAMGISRHMCPTCGKRRYMLWRHTAWYGIDQTCLRCGEEWQDGERCERPFARAWRRRSVEAARVRYREWQARQQVQAMAARLEQERRHA